MRVSTVNFVRRMPGDLLSYVSRDAGIGKAADECVAERVERECAESSAFSRGFIGYGVCDTRLVHESRKCIGQSLMPTRRTIVQRGK